MKYLSVKLSVIFKSCYCINDTVIPLIFLMYLLSFYYLLGLYKCIFCNANSEHRRTMTRHPTILNVLKRNLFSSALLNHHLILITRVSAPLLPRTPSSVHACLKASPQRHSSSLRQTLQYYLILQPCHAEGPYPGVSLSYHNRGPTATALGPPNRLIQPCLFICKQGFIVL